MTTATTIKSKRNIAGRKNNTLLLLCVAATTAAVATTTSAVTSSAATYFVHAKSATDAPAAADQQAFTANVNGQDVDVVIPEAQPVTIPDGLVQNTVPPAEGGIAIVAAAVDGDLQPATTVQPTRRPGSGSADRLTFAAAAVGMMGVLFTTMLILQ